MLTITRFNLHLHESACSRSTPSPPEADFPIRLAREEERVTITSLAGGKGMHERFAGAWTTGLAYMASALFYRTATIDRHPRCSLLWVAVICALFPAAVMIMRQTGSRGNGIITGLPDGAKA